MTSPSKEWPDPRYSGRAGKVWELHGGPRDELNVAHTASLGMWLIDAPQANPFWRYHGAFLVHLDDIPGTPPPIKQRPDATHEFAMYSLDPDYDDRLNPYDLSTFHRLREPDLVENLVLPNHQRAVEVVNLALQQCVDGVLVPDGYYRSQYRSQWSAFFASQE